MHVAGSRDKSSDKAVDLPIVPVTSSASAASVRVAFSLTSTPDIATLLGRARLDVLRF